MEERCSCALVAWGQGIWFAARRIFLIEECKSSRHNPPKDSISGPPGSGIALVVLVTNKTLTSCPTAACSILRLGLEFRLVPNGQQSKPFMEITVVSNSLQSLWQSNQSALNAWVSLPSVFSAEIATHTGFDAVTVDLQHGLADISDLPSLLAGIKASGVTPVVRVPWLEAGDIMRCLDMGALGIICPMINTPEQATEFASYALYPPEGVRSNGPIRASLVCEGDYGNQANEMITRFAMLETREAITNAEAILSTPGIDAYYLGPSDLARSYGYPAKLDHQDGELYDIIVATMELAHRLGKRAGIHCGTVEYAQKMRDLGYDFVTGWADGVALKNTATQTVASFRQGQVGESSVY